MRHYGYLVFCLFLSVLLAGQDYRFSKLTPDEGLSHSTVYALTQDHRGFIWIGTRAGLDRYDGYGIRPFTPDGIDPVLASEKIRALCAARGNLYVGTEDGLIKYDITKERFDTLTGPYSVTGWVWEIRKVASGDLIVSSNTGLYRIESDDSVHLLAPGTYRSTVAYGTDRFMVTDGGRVMLLRMDGTLIATYEFPDLAERRVTVNQLYLDAQATLWAATTHGLFRFSDEAGFTRVPLAGHDQSLESTIVRCISEDERGRLWVGTEDGAYVHSPTDGTTRKYTQDLSGSSSGLSDKSIYAVLHSREGIVWLGTYFGGVNMARSTARGFREIRADGTDKGLGGKAVSEITVPADGKLWIGTEDGGLTLLDRPTGEITHLRHGAGPGALSSDNIHAVHEDRRGNVWIGTFAGGLDRYRPATGHVTNYRHTTDDSTSLSNDYVNAILHDRSGRLWVGTQGGLNLYDYASDDFKLFHHAPLRQAFIFDLLEDSVDGSIWMATHNRGIYRWFPDEDRLEHYLSDTPTGRGMTSNSIISIYQDDRGVRWFGTLDGGLLQHRALEGGFRAWQEADGLPDNTVYGTLGDDHGQLWLTTDKGLARLDPETGDVLTFDQSAGLPTNQFNFRSAYRDRDGWMYFGSIRGICYFHPDSIWLPDSPPDLYFTGLRLFNDEVRPDPAEGPLPRSIDELNRLTLPYSDNVLTLEFVALDDQLAGSAHYAYYLEGFEGGYNAPTDQRSATYTNLSPGDYTFHLRATDRNGRAGGVTRSLPIRVLPPFWKSLPAYGLYAVLLGLACFGYVRFLHFLQRQRMTLQLERLEKAKIEEINQHKLTFFTYISHEFKTPLTLIIASVESFLREPGLHRRQTAHLLAVKRSAGRLRFLIEQLMEFRKTETDHACLDLRRGDVIPYLRDTFDAFLPLLGQKSIRGVFHSDQTGYLADFDADKLEKIVTNLISNACKYTGEYGEITLRVSIAERETPRLILRLSDTGSGIVPDQHGRVTELFFRHDIGTALESEGSGIGLALVDSLVRFLGGTMELRSSPGEGTVVEVQLPLVATTVSDTPAPATITGNKGLRIDNGLLAPPAYPDDSEESTVDTAKRESARILVVEDNPDLLAFLSRHFNHRYSVVTAADGAQALKRIEASLPDLIISDVMMPGMDGIELTRHVRQNPYTSHVPILLLTARSTFQSRLEGLGVGADGYLDKPFNLDELDLVTTNLLQSHQRLRTHFLKFGSLETADIPYNTRDQETLIRIKSVIEEHMADADLTIVLLAEKVGMSRSLLHLKLKKLIDMSASEFIKSIRLQRAKEMLAAGNQVSTTAYEVGFNDPSYFSRSFKKTFAMTPRQFQQEALERAADEQLTGSRE